MGNFIDISNQKFNAFTALHYDKNKHRWKCKCQCGNIRYATLYQLKNNRYKSCGCDSYFELIGKTVGKLKVIGLSDKTRLLNGEKYLDCECLCGNKLPVLVQSLKNNRTMSCGKCYENTVDKNFFNLINTKEKAYILGMFYADGYNQENKQTIQLSLQSNDDDILYKIKDVMKYEGNIKYYQSKECSFNIKGKNRKYKVKPTAKISIHNTQLSDQLAKKGCTNNKTYNLTFPNETILPKELRSHFIRGLMDGDGSIYCNHKEGYTDRFHVSFTGTLEIIKSLSDIMCKITRCNPQIKLDKNFNNNNNASVTINGNRVCKCFLDWVYTDATIYLERKYQKYKHLLEEIHKVNMIKPSERKGLLREPKPIRNLDTMKLYLSGGEASRDLNICPATISYFCKRRDKFLVFENDFQNNNYTYKI